MLPSVGAPPYYPGGGNSDFLPSLKIIDHDPVVTEAFGPDHPITFRVRVWDDKPLPADAVKVGYASIADPGAVNEVTMRDDGLEGDSVAGDLIYTAFIDGPVMSGKLIYYFTVDDSDGNTIRVPHLSSMYRTLFVGPLTDDHLIISEVLAANRACRCTHGDQIEPQPEGCELGGIDNFGEADSWVEITNPTDESINLADYYVTNRLDWLTRWRFPEWATEEPLGPGERIIVWCDDAIEQDAPDYGAIHADFLLDPRGDAVVLVRDPGERQIVDYVAFADQVNDIPYGRDGTTGAWGMVLEPTLGGENAQLAANARWITELGDWRDPQELAPGSQVTITGTALDQATRLVIVDPLPCEPREFLHSDWDWSGVNTQPHHPQWSLQGNDLQVTLPANLAAGPLLLCVLS
jgi:hypothetical protein